MLEAIEDYIMRCVDCGNLFHSSQGATIYWVCADCEAEVIAEIMANMKLNHPPEHLEMESILDIQQA